MTKPFRRRCSTIWYAITIALGWVALGGAAQAQCVGDCNADQEVAINELITGVNISLGSAALSACEAFDSNSSGEVEINELILGVTNSLNGCPTGGSPTPTPRGATPTGPIATATATHTVGGPTSTVTATPTMGTGVCGNNVVENDQGETCDDGNTEDGDSCPADCRIETCPLFQGTVTGDITFTTASTEQMLLGLSLFLKYPDGVVDVPGNGPNDPPTLEAVGSDFFATTPNDRDYGINLVLTDPLTIGVPGDSIAATITFALCQGASPPPASSFQCTVINATDTNLADVTDQVDCTFALR